jgi:hypothetical protein
MADTPRQQKMIPGTDEDLEAQAGISSSSSK